MRKPTAASSSAATSRQKIDAKICYEVNIYDKRPDPSYGTGGIVDVAKVDPMPKAAGKWNTYENHAQGPHLVVVLNGQRHADVQDSKHASGPVALAIWIGHDQNSARCRSSRCKIGLVSRTRCSASLRCTAEPGPHLAHHSQVG